MSEEIIKVLDHIGDKLGIAIDWSSENIWPYVTDILNRYRNMKLIENSGWLIFCIILIIAAFVALAKIAHGIKEQIIPWYSPYRQSSSAEADVTCIVCIIGVVFLVVISIVIFSNILKWAIVPELKYLEMLKMYM